MSDPQAIFTPINKMQSPKERLTEIAEMNPKQMICVALVDDKITMSWEFANERAMGIMLSALEEQLAKEIQFRRNKALLDVVKEHGVKLNG